MLEIYFTNEAPKENDAIAILVKSAESLNLESIDKAFHGAIKKAVSNKDKFEPKLGHVLHLTCANSEGELKNIILVGVANESALQEHNLESIGGHIHVSAKTNRADKISLHLANSLSSVIDTSKAASLIANGAMLSSYKFDKYFTKQTPQEKFAVQSMHIVVSDHNKAQMIFDENKSIVLGTKLARDLISEAPNILYPASYADIVYDKLSDLGVKVSILGENEMRELGMGALLGVGQGSQKESKMVVMEYYGSSKNEKPVCFVGKGVTFDTGGISIKPASGMWDMKYDMAGSAAVVGAVYALAARKAKANIVGIIGLVENMPGSNAQRPSDIVTTMSGQTVEVLNTDAEGRLVLCDCLTYAQQKFAPACIIDLATLTGAIIVALASTYAGMFANDDDLAKQLAEAGAVVNEKLWRMPLHKDYDEMLKSTVADIANVPGDKGGAGSATAAQFLGRFIEKDTKWAHLDIAGVAWDKNGKNPICPKGAVGFGVKLLEKFVQLNYESK